MCYTCEASFNQLGQPLGWGDMSCVGGLEERHLEFCDEESTLCATTFEADWLYNGQQQYTMRRGCVKVSVKILLSDLR